MTCQPPHTAKTCAASYSSRSSLAPSARRNAAVSCRGDINMVVRRLARKKAASTTSPPKQSRSLSLSPRSHARALVAVHGHPLRAAAHLALRRRADGPAAVALGTALLQRQQLLGAERLVVDLRRRLDEVLEVGAEQEVAEVDEFAVVLVLDVDNAPPVLAAADLLAVDDDGLFRADDGEGDEALRRGLAMVVEGAKGHLSEGLTLISLLTARSSSSNSSLS